MRTLPMLEVSGIIHRTISACTSCYSIPQGIHRHMVKLYDAEGMFRDLQIATWRQRAWDGVVPNKKI